MGIDAIITLVVIVVTLLLFVWEYFSVDLVALGAIVVLVASGVLSVEEGFAGFSSEATLTVAAMFALSNALIKTQIIEYLGPLLQGLFKKGYRVAVLSLGGLVGTVSAFINNTPIVATFIPIVNTSAREIGDSPSRYLMPLSFVAILGGTCTLIGTSTNLLVSAMATERGAEGFGMFTLAPFGLILFAAGMLYLLLFGKRIIPERSSSDELKEQEGVPCFLAEIKLRSKPEQEDQTLEALFSQYAIEVKALKRGGETKTDITGDEQLSEDDVLLIEGDLSKIRKLVKDDYYDITESFEEKQFPQEETHLIEIVLLSGSELIGKKLDELKFLNRYQAKVIAIRQRGKKQYSGLEDIRLQSGDVLVLLTNEHGHKLLQQEKQGQRIGFLSLHEERVDEVDKSKLLIVLGCIAAVILLASLNVVPISIGAFGAIVLFNLLDIMNMNDVYRAIDWKVVFLLAGSLSLGTAMTSSGLSDDIGQLLLQTLKQYGGPMLMVGLFYLVTSLLTEMISNNASAALMVPIAFSLAESLGIEVQPLLLTIAFAGSASFMTPIGYQTNTMIYSAGSYRFTDFIKVGTPLNLLFLILASIFIPLIYPFH